MSIIEKMLTAPKKKYELLDERQKMKDKRQNTFVGMLFSFSNINSSLLFIIYLWSTKKSCIYDRCF